MGVLDEVRRHQRERELSSDERAGSWARAEARRVRRQHFRRNAWSFLVGFLLMAAPSTVLALLFVPWEFLQGLLIGAAGTGAIGVIWHVTVLVTGTGSQTMGEWGEQNTAAELRRLRRSGWRLVNHVSLTQDDIDHVLVGPGGVYAVETKWSARGWNDPVMASRIGAAAEQAKRYARLLTKWTSLKGLATPVRPLVVLWGGVPAGRHVPGGLGVEVVHGSELRTWLATLPSDGLDPAAVGDVWSVLSSQAETRDAHTAQHNPAPRSFTGWVTPASVVLATGSVTAMTVAAIASSTLWAGTLVALGAITAGCVFVWLNVVRALGWGLLAGVAAVAVTVAGTVGTQL